MDKYDITIPLKTANGRSIYGTGHIQKYLNTMKALVERGKDNPNNFTPPCHPQNEGLLDPIQQGTGKTVLLPDINHEAVRDELRQLQATAQRHPG